jgi:hypothetical protein
MTVCGKGHLQKIYYNNNLFFRHYPVNCVSYKIPGFDFII